MGRVCAKKQRAVPLWMTPTPLGGLVAGGALQKNTFAVPHALSKRTVHRGGCSPWCVRLGELESRLEGIYLQSPTSHTSVFKLFACKMTCCSPS